MLDYFGIDIDKEECKEEEFGDCTELFGLHVTGVESCEYYSIYDICADADVSCDAVAVINGTQIENTCEWFETEFDLPTDDTDCIEVLTTDCMEYVPENY